MFCCGKGRIQNRSFLIGYGDMVGVNSYSQGFLEGRVQLRCFLLKGQVVSISIRKGFGHVCHSKKIYEKKVVKLP